MEKNTSLTTAAAEHTIPSIALVPVSTGPVLISGMEMESKARFAQADLLSGQFADLEKELEFLTGKNCCHFYLRKALLSILEFVVGEDNDRYGFHTHFNHFGFEGSCSEMPQEATDSYRAIDAARLALSLLEQSLNYSHEEEIRYHSSQLRRHRSAQRKRRLDTICISTAVAA